LQFGLQYLEIALSALRLSTGEPSNIGYNKIKEPRKIAMDPTCRLKWVQWLPLTKVHLNDHINDGSSIVGKEKEEKFLLCPTKIGSGFHEQGFHSRESYPVLLMC
jgi:hypothetical protein